MSQKRASACVYVGCDKKRVGFCLAIQSMLSLTHTIQLARVLFFDNQRPISLSVCAFRKSRKFPWRSVYRTRRVYTLTACFSACTLAYHRIDQVGATFKKISE